jgi:hypothetical protein
LKTLLLIPAVLIPLAALAWAVPAALGRTASARDLAAAAVICLLSAEFALLPAVLLRKSGPAVISQAALAGTAIHMFLGLLLAALAWVAHLIVDKKSFLFLLLAFFWVSLIVLVLAMVRLIRRAQSQQPSMQPK